MKSIRLVGILLMIFIENKHWRHVQEVYAESVATGIMGLMVRLGGYYMAVWRYEISLRVLKNISLVSAGNE